MWQAEIAAKYGFESSCARAPGRNEKTNYPVGFVTTVLFRDVAAVIAGLAVVIAASTVYAADADSLDAAKRAFERGDYATAVPILQKLADKGDRRAQNNLGLMYSEGKGVTKNYTEALKWLRKSAEQGYVNAETNLGAMYERGLGVKQDFGEALKWYRKAADRGFANAEYNLGVMYYHGVGVKQDYGTAFKWFRLAADQNFADAQYNLGVMHFYGYGVPQSLVQAHAWWSMAASQGDQIAQKSRDELATKMTASQIVEAERLIRQWKAQAK